VKNRGKERTDNIVVDKCSLNAYALVTKSLVLL